MSLDLKKLEKLVGLADGMKRARCPACAEKRQDTKGEHLLIYPDGRFGCCLFPRDREHRKQIFALAGERGRQDIKVRVVAAKPGGSVQSGILGRLGRMFSTQVKNPASTDATDGVSEVETRPAESRTLRTGETKSSGDVCPAANEPRTQRTGLSNSNGELALDDCLPLEENGNPRTLRTPFENSRVYLKKVPSVEGEYVSTLKEFREGVRSVRDGEGSERPPEPAEKLERLPYLTPGGSLVIPFSSPERYHYWKGDDRLSPEQTLAEVRQRIEDEKRKAHNATGI